MTPQYRPRTQTETQKTSIYVSMYLAVYLSIYRHWKFFCLVLILKFAVRHHKALRSYIGDPAEWVSVQRSRCRRARERERFHRVHTDSRRGTGAVSRCSSPCGREKRQQKSLGLSTFVNRKETCTCMLSACSLESARAYYWRGGLTNAGWS